MPRTLLLVWTECNAPCLPSCVRARGWRGKSRDETRSVLRARACVWGRFSVTYTSSVREREGGARRIRRSIRAGSVIARCRTVRVRACAKLRAYFA